MIGSFILIIGPSGVGKSALLCMLKEKHPEYVFPKSATTRARRIGEGDDLYQFISDQEFDQWLVENKFLEWAMVHRSARYGTLIHEIIEPMKQGKVVIREVDAQGFLNIKRHPLFVGDHQLPLKTIFILPESEEQLLRHITKRAPMEQEELKRRLESMRLELAIAPETDVQIVNREGKIDETLKQIERVINE